MSGNLRSAAGAERAIRQPTDMCVPRIMEFRDSQYLFMIELKDIEKLAELSRINVSGEEKQTFLKDIESILNYVDQIKTVAEGADMTMSRQETELVNVFREDKDCHDSGRFTEALIESAPEKENGFIRVKKIL